MQNKISRKIQKNKIYRIWTNKYELKKMVLKHLMNVYIIPINYLNSLYYSQKYKKSSISYIKNICIFTARYRGVSSYYKLSRLKLKQFGTMGLIPGLRKSSW